MAQAQFVVLDITIVCMIPAETIAAVVLKRSTLAFCAVVFQVVRMLVLPAMILGQLIVAEIKLAIGLPTGSYLVVHLALEILVLVKTMGDVIQQMVLIIMEFVLRIAPVLLLRHRRLVLKGLIMNGVEMLVRAGLFISIPIAPIILIVPSVMRGLRLPGRM
ncbi:hypothetical protein HYU92_06740 [Candidatus Curtissbacteria bacterium]|nr:hypothetical protein [Candidatus Curtissbacteria bacterium]